MEERKSSYPVLPELLNRWSGRAMSGRSVSKRELMTLFEAARYAPSARNTQPWRFVFSTHRSPKWQEFLALLEPSYKGWCTKAAALILLMVEQGDSNLAIFDAGSAWENLAIQGCSMGLVIHPTAMFNHEAAKKLLSIPDNYEILLMISVGRPGDPKLLPMDLQACEFPKGRKKLSEICFKESFDIR